ncbi:MAG: TatD family hydrolase [Oscillospiraceae bacterium]
MFFDTHAHYDDEKFDADRDELLASMEAAGVELIVDPASDIASAEKARGIAERFAFVYFAAGVHPHEAQAAAPEYLHRVRELAAHPKCVAIGEIGLDYHYDFSPRDVQRQVLEEQLCLAEELNKPVIIHEREACADCMDILHRHRGLRGVVHCYSGSWETARELLDMGWYISFTGAVTFKNARRPVEVVSKLPLDRLMIETDSPYMAPVPCRGERNSSLLLHFIAERIAEIRGVTTEEIARATAENGRRFFNIS